MRLIDADALKAKIRKSEQEIKRIRKEIVRDLKHWQYLREYGCQDPFWADGVNMNLTRNHIIYYKMRLRELCPGCGEEVCAEYCESCGQRLDWSCVK